MAGTCLRTLFDRLRPERSLRRPPAVSPVHLQTPRPAERALRQSTPPAPCFVPPQASRRACSSRSCTRSVSLRRGPPSRISVIGEVMRSEVDTMEVSTRVQVDTIADVGRRDPDLPATRDRRSGKTRRRRRPSGGGQPGRRAPIRLAGFASPSAKAKVRSPTPVVGEASFPTVVGNGRHVRSVR